jgi:hypothetical protein
LIVNFMNQDFYLRQGQALVVVERLLDRYARSHDDAGIKSVLA